MIRCVASSEAINLRERIALKRCRKSDSRWNNKKRCSRKPHQTWLQLLLLRSWVQRNVQC